MTFLAVAGKSSYEASERRVGDWFSAERILWGYSDEIWGAYAVRSQPSTMLISSDDVIVSFWFGALEEADLRAELDRLVEIG